MALDCFNETVCVDTEIVIRDSKSIRISEIFDSALIH